MPHWRIDLRLNELDSFRLVEHSDFALGGTYSHFMALEDGLYQVYAQVRRRGELKEGQFLFIFLIDQGRKKTIIRWVGSIV